MAVEVYRYSGAYRGADIDDPGLTTDAIQIERGTAELDAQAQPTQTYTLGCLYDGGYKPGQLVEVDDTREVWIGKITSVSHAFSLDGIRTTLQVERALPGLRNG